MNILLILMAIVLGGEAAQAAPSFWKVESEKRIYFAPEPLVQVRRDELHADDEIWDRVSITFGYVGAETVKQASQIRSVNPGWEVLRIPVQKSGSLRLRIPALGIDEEVDSLPSVDGPYFNASYFVKKKDSRTVKAALANLAGFLEVNGTVAASVPKEIVVERVELPSTICREFRKNGNDVYGAMLSFPAVEAMISTAAKREENRASLKKMVLSSCLDIGERARVNSFADLLDLPLKELVPESNFVAEHRTMGRVDQQIPLRSRTVLEE